MDKYLGSYAEPGGEAIRELPAGPPWGRAVVIPLCREQPDILRPLPPAPGRSLLVLVVNEAEGAPPRVAAANRAFAAAVRRRFAPTWQGPGNSGLTLLRDPDSERDVLLVDRFSGGLRLPPGDGVGLARKIGADLAARLIHRGRVNSPWIHCSDADVRLPITYFDAAERLPRRTADESAALLYPFRHTAGAGGRLGMATLLYEYSMRHYVAGLARAASPYAFHTIGSTMAVNAVHYALVRGFPRRQAGEDFYLLNKLAKVGRIHQAGEAGDCRPIEIAARESDRVPFGTGAAVGKILRMDDPLREFRFYHPDVFRLLRGWLASLRQFWRTRSTEPQAVLGPLGLGPVCAALDAQGLPNALRHALRQSADEAQFHRQMHTWFDAFRTLKLIHQLRDHHRPSIGWEELQAEPGAERLMDFEPRLRSLRETIRELGAGT